MILRAMQILFATQMFLGTLLLGMGERDLRLAVLALIVSVSSVYLTDMRGWLLLSQRVANWAGLAALALSIRDWYTRYEPDSQLLALANLLVYLQFVLLYRRKNTSTYWQLLLLSLMQVAVAAALNLAPSFGLVLVAYLVVGVAACSLFYLLRESRTELGAVGAPSGLVSDPGTRWWSDFASADPPLESALGLSWALQLILLMCGALALSALFFLAVPRSGGPTWQPTAGSASLQVGVTESIKLGEVGQVFENPETTMRAQFTNYITGQPYRLLDEPYFRGLTLTTYERGVWSQTHDPEENPRPLRVAEASEYLGHPELVRQKITIEPLDTDVLYAVFPILNPIENPSLRYDRRTRQLLRAAGQRGNPFNLDLVTTGFHLGRQSELMPAMGDLDRYDLDLLARLPERSPVASLAQQAQQLVGDLPEENWVARAKRLEAHFQSSGQYRYSLDLEVGDPNLDPIEDFLLNTRSGHCEYFASGLALMLRAVGIPSRVVVGFKGGDWNSFGSFYQIRQLHTHAWVEAYLPPDKLPERLDPPAGQWRGGAWLRLDGTPVAERLAAMPPPNTALMTYRQGIDYLRHLWANYVLGLDAQRQRETIYRPLMIGVTETWNLLSDPEHWKQWWARAVRFFRGERSGWLSGEWFNWRAGLSASAICLGLVGLLRGARWCLARLAPGTWRRIRAGAQAGPAPIGFQRELEEILAGYDLVRGSSQTQREFAESVAGRLAATGPTRRVARVPLAIVQAFYRVRFGNRPLDSREAEQVEQGLADLRAALSAADAADASLGAAR